MTNNNSIEEQSRAFSQRIEDLLQNVLGPLPSEQNYTADPQGSYLRGGISGYVIQQFQKGGIPLIIDGSAQLLLSYNFHCSCSSASGNLQVEASSIQLSCYANHEPIVRYDYLRNKTHEIPNAHINIYGSNDTVSRIMLACTQGKRAKSRRKEFVDKGDFPTFSKLHFPVGGNRMRPGIEDVLQFAIYEFHIDVQPNWQEAIEKSRSEYRKRQVAAIVREFPDIAYQVFKDAGYSLDTVPVPPDRGNEGNNLIKY